MLVHGVVQVVAHQRRLEQPRHLITHVLGCVLAGDSSRERRSLLATLLVDGMRCEQVIVRWVESGAVHLLISLRIDEVDCDAQVRLREQLVLGLRLGSRIVPEAYKGRFLEIDFDQLRVRGDGRERVIEGIRADEVTHLEPSAGAGDVGADGDRLQHLFALAPHSLFPLLLGRALLLVMFALLILELSLLLAPRRLALCVGGRGFVNAVLLG
mmetsp:Transcript_512/g.1031  ORF Transcript_512/g.1031 Transcript_512/m.1031 type:complete len:212 (+) Transcript_512:1364-1999(+)